MSETLSAANAKPQPSPKYARRYIHAEKISHINLIVASLACLLFTAALAWEASKQCSADCVFGEYLLIFSPVASVMLLLYACWRIHLRKRLGRLILQLHQPLRPGCRVVPAALTFTGGLGKAVRYPAADYPLGWELVCIQVDQGAENLTTNTLWSKELKDIRIRHGAGKIDFTITLPPDLPRSGLLGHSDFKIIWKLQLRVLGAKVSFVLPVKSAQTTTS